MQEQAPQTDTPLTQPRSYKVRKQQVYVIEREGGGTKVGISAQPKRRKSGLQMASPEKLTLTKTYRTGAFVAVDVEKQVHADLLASLRMKGEWFDCHAAVAEIAVEAVLEACPHKREFVRLYVILHKAEAEWLHCAQSKGKDYWPLEHAATAAHRAMVNLDPDLAERVNPWWRRRKTA